MGRRDVTSQAFGWVLFLGLAVGAACQSSTAPERSREARQAVTSSAERAPVSSTSGAPVAPPKSDAVPAVKEARHPGAERVVAIGDLHGDLQAMRDVLRLAGATDESDRWVGGKLVVVQTGDQLDRGDDEREILDGLQELALQARAAGGAVVVLNGNHETMNVQGDFRYVTPGALGDFAGADDRLLPPAIARQVPEAVKDRARALLPGGKYAKLLGERPVIAIVGDSVFAHGGVHWEHVLYGIDRLNRETAAWMRGEAPEPSMLQSEDSPVWSRRYSTPAPTAEACRELERVLDALGARRLVVGHTIQAQGISSACGERVFRIDVGMSAHYGGQRVMALEITPRGTRILERTKSNPALPRAAE